MTKDNLDSEKNIIECIKSVRNSAIASLTIISMFNSLFSLHDFKENQYTSNKNNTPTRNQLSFNDKKTFLDYSILTNPIYLEAVTKLTLSIDETLLKNNSNKKTQDLNKATTTQTKMFNAREKSIKNFYNSIKESPDYPKNFVALKNGTTKNTVKNKELLYELRDIASGVWFKIYKDGYIGNKKTSLHYFQNNSGIVFNVKVKNGWSNCTCKC